MVTIDSGLSCATGLGKWAPSMWKLSECWMMIAFVFWPGYGYDGEVDSFYGSLHFYQVDIGHSLLVSLLDVSKCTLLHVSTYLMCILLMHFQCYTDAQAIRWYVPKAPCNVLSLVISNKECYGFLLNDWIFLLESIANLWKLIKVKILVDQNNTNFDKKHDKVVCSN